MLDKNLKTSFLIQQYAKTLFKKKRQTFV